MKNLSQQLQQFKEQNRINTKGPLCVVLVMTRTAIKEGLPLDPEDLVTKQSGQVKGLGKSAVQNILKEYGITKILANEGGRTSRGSMGIMKNYIGFLNGLNTGGKLDLYSVEKWWIGKVKEFFMAKPFKLSIDNSKSVTQIIGSLFDQAVKRQAANPGTMYVGALMQHLVGAKLELALPNEKLEHNGFSVADEPKDRPGDFIIGNVAIHVTTNPSEALIDKCKANLEQRIRPIIITSQKGIPAAELQAESKSIPGRIDYFEIEQFITTNLYELSSFKSEIQELTIKELVEKYNAIVDEHETDPSLKIKI